MKIFVSADMEGLPCSTSWADVDASKPEYREAQKIMTACVNAACVGANAAGAKDITVKDAHWTGRNISTEALPQNVKISRGWSGHPYSMIEGLDSSFDALLMVGYHSAASSSGHPLAHTMSSSKYSAILLNDEPMSEFHLHAYAAATMGVPTVFVSGDEELCAVVGKVNDRIAVAPVCRGFGAATVSDHPSVAYEKIRDGVRKSLQQDVKACVVTLPSQLHFSVVFKNHADAFKASFYPGAVLENPHRVGIHVENFLDAMRFRSFV